MKQKNFLPRHNKKKKNELNYVTGLFTAGNGFDRQCNNGLFLCKDFINKREKSKMRQDGDKKKNNEFIAVSIKININRTQLSQVKKC